LSASHWLSDTRPEYVASDLHMGSEGSELAPPTVATSLWPELAPADDVHTRRVSLVTLQARRSTSVPVGPKLTEIWSGGVVGGPKDEP
jgi:hypothetical protein